MKPPLYLTPAVRNGLSPFLRPGGAAITRRILQLTTPSVKALTVDAGCGSGGGLDTLRQHGLTHLIGIDLNPDLLAEAGNLGLTTAQAELSALPLKDNCLDLLVCECAWNLSSRAAALAEFARVLRPGGQLALADIYLRNPVKAEWPVTSCFAKAQSIQSVRELVTDIGFRIIHTEDHSNLLTQAAAEFTFAHGSLAGFWQSAVHCPEKAEHICRSASITRPGLFLLIGECSSA